MGCLSFLFLVQIASAAPTIGIRDNDTPQHDVSPWVAKLIAIGLVIFFSVLIALYLYRKLKPNVHTTPTPLFAAPMRNGPRQHPVMGRAWRPSSLHRSSSSAASRPSPSTQASPANQNKENTEYPPQAHITRISH